MGYNQSDLFSVPGLRRLLSGLMPFREGLPGRSGNYRGRSGQRNVADSFLSNMEWPYRVRQSFWLMTFIQPARPF